MSDFTDTPTSEGATVVVLNQREALAPFARKEVHIRGSEAAGRALGFDVEGKLSTLLVGGDGGGAAGPVELADMAPLPHGRVIGRKTAGGGVPEAVTVPEMIALDVAGTKAALGKTALSDMANLAQGKVIGRKTAGAPGVPEAITVAEMMALDPTGVRAALGKVALSDMADLTRGRLIARVSTSPNPGVPEAVTLPQLISVDPEGAKNALGKIELDEMADLPSGTIIGNTSLSAGVPAATTVATMVALDPEEVRIALNVNEDPFMLVDDEIEFNTALAAGRSLALRGEGSGGVISLTTQKVVNARFTTIKSDVGAVLRFGALTGADNPRAITIRADDVTLSNFELTSSIPDLATNNCYGLVFNEGVASGTPGFWGHRMVVRGLTIHNWQRCISKDGSELTTPHEGVLIEQCFIHTAKEMCVQVNFGFHRLVMRDCRIMPRLTWNPATVTHNCVVGGSNWRDCLIENCYFANTYRHAFEATIANSLLPYYNERTRVVLCRAENCGDMAFSLGFCRGGVFAHCTAKNILQAGFEVGGRVTGHPASGGNPSYFAQAIIDSCEVDGVTHPHGPAYGFTLDGAADTIVRGACRIRNVSSTFESEPSANDGACGIGLTDCERCSIQGVVLEDCGHKFIYADAVYLPITTASGFHDITNNVFRNPAGHSPGVPVDNHYAIWVRNQCASIRQNVAFQKPTTFLGYQSVQSGGSANVVTVDGTPVGGGAVLLAGSNIICNG